MSDSLDHAVEQLIDGYLEHDSPGTSLEPADMTREEFLAAGGDEDTADFYYGE
ncbi:MULTISPECIES: hypothetical protein [Streptosporangium]|uniref:Uncharacterized protein n=1 Tax=Streptosporangium brasiliense TaxID=47480 RepID=A0ABT9RQ43_9ACTN|nr:hypothetical protein [Streptosporangium brasiliense]MDP9870410.1 hypothetical protein [Streptosporangium brasiliense]